MINPKRLQHDRVMIIFNSLLFVALYNGYYIGDIRNGKWYKCEKLMITLKNTTIIDTKDNYIHFFGNGASPPFHLKIYLLDIIPNILIKEYQKNMYNPLIYGYIKNEIKNLNLLNKYPHQLTQIILSYFPVFMYV